MTSIVDGMMLKREGNWWCGIMMSLIRLLIMYNDKRSFHRTSSDLQVVRLVFPESFFAYLHPRHHTVNLRFLVRF